MQQPAFRVWIRHTSQDASACAVRFVVAEGKGVLRVSRPGVLIVPPARPQGHEDHLTAAQVRSSLFLHAAGRGRARNTFSLEGLTDAVITTLDVDTWHELTVTCGPAGERRLEYTEQQDVINLGGASDAEPDESTTQSISQPNTTSEDLRQIGRIVERRRAGMVPDQELLDEVIEADSDTARSQTGALLFRATDLPDELIDPPSANALQSLTPTVEAIELRAPPVRLSTHAHPDVLPESHIEEELRVFPGGPRKLARHLRRLVERRELSIVQLQARVAILEQALRALGGDPETL